MIDITGCGWMTKAGTGRRMVIIVHEWMREVGKKNTYEIADFLLENSSSYHMTTSNLAQTNHPYSERWVRLVVRTRAALEERLVFGRLLIGMRLLRTTP